MKPAIWQLSVAVIAYLGALFAVAYAAERGRLPARLVRHPLVYALSLGVYTTAWTYYGGVGLAASQGYQFLTIYIGVTLTFLLSPVLLRPLLRLVRDYQLTSLADLFAFRYPSRLTGVLVTLLMLMGLLPYIALQIQAVVTSAQVIAGKQVPAFLAPSFCFTVTAFTLLFGARQITPREKHEGLVVAIAFESAIKLVAILAVAAFAVFGVFGSWNGLDQWLAVHPEAVAQLYAPVREGGWTTLLLLAFSAAFLLPRQFQMIFTENIEPRSLGTASWAFPLFLLLLNFGVPPILWAARSLNLQVPPDYYLLALARQEGSGLLTLIAFVGGVSAASAMIIVESLALAAMALNHLVLPTVFALRPPREQNLYRALMWSRRVLIAVVIFTGYLTFLLIERSGGLARLGLISFVAVAQFLPAILGLLTWSRANRVGFLAGVSAGMVVWILTLILPLFGAGQAPLLPTLGLDVWSYATFWSLSANSLLFVTGSLLVTPSAREVAADRACRLDIAGLAPAPRLRSVRHLEARIARLLGPGAARAEVERARDELGIAADERGVRQLHRLREQVERNLSGLIGPQLATDVLGDDSARSPVRAAATLVEAEIERSRSRLRGLAAELDDLRRLHRQVLQDLPIGTCSLGAEGEVLLWNAQMEALSALPAERVLGERLADLPPPWGEVLDGFVRSGVAHVYRHPVTDAALADRHTRWLDLHRETVTGDTPEGSGVILLVEDRSDQKRLEAELAHSERLASIGTFAAGIAHEIGNPLTGISSLAQNLREEADPMEWSESVESILGQTRRIRDIVQSLLNFAHAGSESLGLSRFGLRPLVEEAIRLVRLSPAGRAVRFDDEAVAVLSLEGDRARLLQVLVNLLANAADASPPGASIEVRAAVVDEAERAPGALRLAVADRGAGIPPELLERVFEPFFTTKDPGRGTGLGLPLAYGIVKEHGGTIRIDAREGGGTVVTIELPGADAREDAA